MLCNCKCRKLIFVYSIYKIMTDIFGKLENVIEAPFNIFSKGEDALENLLGLPEKIINLIEMMIVPGMLIAGVMVVSEIRK